MEGEPHSVKFESSQPHTMKEVDWAEGDVCSSKRMGEADSTAMWCHAHSLEPVMICQNSGIKMGGHKRWKSQTWRLCRISVSMSEPFIIGWCSACHYCQLCYLTVCIFWIVLCL